MVGSRVYPALLRARSFSSGRPPGAGELSRSIWIPGAEAPSYEQRPVKTGLQTNIFILTINVDGYPALKHVFYRREIKIGEQMV